MEFLQSLLHRQRMGLSQLEIDRPSHRVSAQLSAERNNYINMLTILSEKISNIMELNIAMENEILLQENSNNGC